MPTDLLVAICCLFAVWGLVRWLDDPDDMSMAEQVEDAYEQWLVAFEAKTGGTDGE